MRCVLGHITTKSDWWDHSVMGPVVVGPLNVAAKEAVNAVVNGVGPLDGETVSDEYLQA